MIRSCDRKGGLGCRPRVRSPGLLSPIRWPAADGRSGRKSMDGRWPAPALVPAFILAAVLTAFGPAVFAQAPPAVDGSFFAEKVFPVLHAAQCERCHSDNGVASETRLEFPEPDAGRDRIAAFGLSLRELVDPLAPEQSLLLRK